MIPSMIVRHSHNTRFDGLMNKIRSKCEEILDPNFKDSYPCGFAWVHIRPARGPLIKYFKDNSIGYLGYNGGWQISAYNFYPHMHQNVYYKEAICQIAIKVLAEDLGISATLSSRWD